mgnify:CR=1 FL=1
MTQSLTRGGRPFTKRELRALKSEREAQRERERWQPRTESDAEQESRRWRAEVEARKAWPGNRRVARWIEGRLEKAGLGVRRNGYDESGASQYLQVSRDGEYLLTVRIADHASPPGGGFSIERQERHGEADVDLYPGCGFDWREAVAKVLARTEEESRWL